MALKRVTGVRRAPVFFVTTTDVPVQQHGMRTGLRPEHDPFSGNAWS